MNPQNFDFSRHTPLKKRRGPIVPKYDPNASAMIIGYYSDMIFYRVKDTIYLKDRREPTVK